MHEQYLRRISDRLDANTIDSLTTHRTAHIMSKELSVKLKLLKS